MTDDPQQLKVENALLRGSLFLTARVLRDYHDARHTKIDDDGIPMLQVTVHDLVRNRAAAALARADRMLKDQGR
jgi:hypothetical protein